MSPDCSSVRRIGRPTIEGNWCSGKFWGSVGSANALSLGRYRATHLRGIADLEETGSSVEDCGLVSLVELGTNTPGEGAQLPMGISAMMEEGEGRYWQRAETLRRDGGYGGIGGVEVGEELMS